MDFNATIDLIIRELEEAREIIDDLKKIPGVPAIEAELAKSKCKSAADVIALLKNLQPSAPSATSLKEPDSGSPASKKKADYDEEAPTSVGKHVKPVESQTDKPFSENEVIPEKKRNVPEKIEPSKPVSADKAAPDEKGIEPETAKPYVAPIIADSFSHLANRFNEQLGGTDDDDVRYMKRKPLTNLSEAIGINDRFFYIREIFGGNRETYNLAITQLEKAESLTQAREVLMSHRTDKKENEAVKQLLNLVKRKFSANE